MVTPSNHLCANWEMINKVKKNGGTVKILAHFPTAP